MGRPAGSLPLYLLRHIVFVKIDVFVSTTIIGPDDSPRLYARLGLICRICADSFLFLHIAIVDIDIPIAVTVILPDNDAVFDIRMGFIAQTLCDLRLLAGGG